MPYVFSYKERHSYATAYDKMIQARATVFGDRPEWHAAIKNSREEDEYDRTCNPLYFVSLNKDGEHSASLRIMPTTGPTMLRREFHKFFDDCPDIISPDIWECTRMCVTGDSTSPEGRAVTIQVSKALCRIAFENGISQLSGLYYKNMNRIYRRIGWEPFLLTHAQHEQDDICLGLWNVNPSALRHMSERQAMLF